jgi:N-acetylglucosaminyl-diphospho-decaprenol L-rhamnosyltransferase
VYGDQLAVVTVTYSPGESLDAFLESLEKATTRPYTVVLADNGSVDGAPERAAERDGVELLRIGENVGYGTAANRAIAGLGDEVGWVVVANPDVVWRPGSLDELLAVGERTPRAGSLGPLIRDADGAVYPSARLVPSLGRGIGHALFGTVWPGNPWTTAYRQTDLAASDAVPGDRIPGEGVLGGRGLAGSVPGEGVPRERDAGWLSGSCLLLRRAAFDSVDGFDPRYFMYFEDVDLGEQLGRAGWRNRYVPTAEVIHTGGHATTANREVSARMLTAHHDSAYRFLADRHPGPRWVPLRLGLRAGLGVRRRLAVRGSRR